MRYVMILVLCVLMSYVMSDWLFGPENFESGSLPAGWYAPTYHDPMYVYGPGYDSDYAVGSGPMSWPNWWGNFVRTPIVDCSTADSVIMSFRMFNTGYPDDFARFYIWVEPSGYFGTVTYDMNTARDWEQITVDFTEYAAGQSQVYFYLEGNFGNDSYTHEVKFDDVGVSTTTVLAVADNGQRKHLNEEIFVYPTPATNYIQYRCNPELGTINLYDISGQKVATVPPGNGQISLAGFSAGIYLLKPRLAQKAKYIIVR